MRTAADEIMDLGLSEEVCERMASLFRSEADKIREQYHKISSRVSSRVINKDEMKRYCELMIYYSMELVREEIWEKLKINKL